MPRSSAPSTSSRTWAAPSRSSGWGSAAGIVGLQAAVAGFVVLCGAAALTLAAVTLQEALRRRPSLAPRAACVRPPALRHGSGPWLPWMWSNTRVVSVWPTTGSVARLSSTQSRRSSVVATAMCSR